MELKQIHELLQQKFPTAIGPLIEDQGQPHIPVEALTLDMVADFLKDDPELDFNYLTCVSTVDLLKLSGASDEEKQTLLVIYHLESFEPETGNIRHEIELRVTVPRDKPDVPSVSRIWQTADWHEREGYDLMGINFVGHPDLRRILTDDDWTGHPLRKDYVFPTEYRGIDLT